MSDAPTIVCVVWKAAALIYWLRDSWENIFTPPIPELVVGTFGISALYDWVSTVVPLDLPYAVLVKVLNQCVLIGCLLVAHKTLENLEKQVSHQIPLCHRACYALLVENCVAFNLTWNYVQTAALVSELLVQDFHIVPDTAVTLHLVLLAIGVLVTTTVELVFRDKFRWTVASFPPLLIWAFCLRRASGVDDTFLYGLLALTALVMLAKVAPVTQSRPDFSQGDKQEELVEDQLSEIVDTDSDLVNNFQDSSENRVV
uniref:Uncharacterized protein n=1 Tax=Branchiostoma floridae TaxID=7739 RepID=C3YZE8_BRAFL|eukprot:XP_002598207.1 hypothetical protein BRAFLDRAFT_69542 [Branchiostoma floridae]